MPQTQTTCPRCHRPVMVNMEQIFDLNQDKEAKQKILSGAFNVIRCPSCGFSGSLATPMVYHDPDKEMLLTFFPPEMGLQVTDQEKLIGPLIAKVMNRLPQEKRKAYLLQPQSMFTLQTLVEKVLEGEGITREMLDEQQKRLSFLQRLLPLSQQDRIDLIKKEEELVDESLFSILNRLVEASAAQGDQQTARNLASLQKDFLTQTAVGQRLQAQAKDAEAAIKSLQEASKNGLTREKILDLLLEAKSEISVTTLVNLTRSGLDYEFFQLLTQRIEAASGGEKEKLTHLREQLLDLTRKIDEQVKGRMDDARKLLDKILIADDIQKTTEENLPVLDDFFIETLKNEMQTAQKNKNYDRLGRIQQVVTVIEKASAPPAEIALIEELMGAKDEESQRKILADHSDQVNAEFLQMLNQLSSQSESQQQPAEVTEQLRNLHKIALRFSMEANLKK